MGKDIAERKGDSSGDGGECDRNREHYQDEKNIPKRQEKTHRE